MRSPLNRFRVVQAFLLSALLILLPATLISCGGGGGGSTPDPVVVAPAITTHPASQTVTAGQAVSFSVVATGTSLTYQWKKDGANVGSNSATLTIAAAAAADAGSYTVVVSNSAGTVTSNAATLTVNPLVVAPAITTHPASQTVTAGQAVSFSVVATGTSPSYQWKKDGANVGSNSATLTIAAAQASDAGSYTVVVSNSAGTVTSNAAVLTVNPVVVAPAITTHPASQTVTAGQAVSFTVVATGTSPSYQWKKDGANVGSNSATLTIAAAQAGDAGSYTVVVSNSAGTVTSNAAVLTVNPVVVAPAITTHPASQTVTAGQAVSFSVVATGTSPSYQWKKDGANVGSNSATLTIAAAAAADAGSYTVVVSNSAGTVTSNAATLTVNPVVVAPAITTHPASQTVTAGQAVSFSVVATGTSPSYQWKKDGANVGSNSATLTIAAAAAGDAGSYTVVVSNSAGSVTSNAAVLTVNAASVTITAHPQNSTATVPDSATFTVTATGTSLSYQWKKDGVDIPGATSTSYTTPATALNPSYPAGTYTYTVAVTSGGSTVTSNGAVLTVQQPDPTYAGDPVPVPTRVQPVWEYVTTYSSRGAFRLAYDEALMNPLWTSYCTYKLDPPSLEQGSRTFRADPRSTAAVADSDFTNSGYTRGHQVMMSDMELRYGGQAGTDTCFTTNVAPQKDTHNNNIWNTFEQNISGSYNSGTGVWSSPGMVGSTNRIWIFTGPTFAASPARTPGKGMAIPNGFWKVLVKEVGGVPKALAVLTPHEPVPPTADLWKYVTNIARIEALTGFNLFPNLPGSAAVDFKTSADVRGWGAPFENSSGPNAHIIQPEWDSTVVAGSSVNFVGYGTSTGTIASATWTFSDGQATTAANTVTRAFAAAGTYTATYTVVDGNGATKAISRQLTVTSSNANPTITAIPAQSTTVGTAKVVAFTVADDATPVASLTFTLSSDNTTLVPNANLVLTGPDTNGLCSLQITPASAQTGTANITIQVSDGSGASASRSFSITVGSGGSAALIISQYYEGTSNNKWIEITNVGAAPYDASVSQLYLGQWNVGNSGTTAGYKVVAIPGTIGPGQTILFKNSAATLPAAANIRAGVTIYNNTTTIDSLMQFNGNDPMFITSVGTATVAAWDARTDAVGDATWLTAAPFVGQDKSYCRNATVKTPRADFQTSEWTQKTNAEVDAATDGSTEQLGFHVVNP